MKSETMAVEHFPLSTNQTYDEEQVDLTERDLCERPHSIKENANNHQSISYFNKAMPESTLTDDEIFRSKLPESRTSALKIKTVYCHTEEGGVGEEHPRISLGNRLGGLQNPLQVLSPDYADPKRVPGTDQNIYPRAPIGPEFHERYPQIVDFFKQAVDNHKFLKYHTSNINYELRLCGSAPSNAVASVVIFCTAAIFKHLRSLLKSKHIQRQYQPKKPFTVNRFQFATNKSHLQISAPVIAPFKVVFWRETLTPTERKSAMEQVVAKSNSFLTMCGSLVRYGDRTSTLGLLISVDSKLYGLTVDHLFKSHRDENQPTVVDERFILPDEDDTEEDHQENWPWVDDVTYENMDNDGWGSDDESVSSGRSHAEMTMDHGLTENCRASRNGHKVDSVAERAPSTPYLDWALIEFDNGYFERPNAWNVILSDSESVIDGDCGSLVVDQETLEVYGHVVASNPLGEAYVIPLHNTFYQIRDALGVLDLALPNPGLLMENLATYYSNAGNAGVAEQANLILASMEGTSSTGNQHDVEDQVYKDPATFLGLDLKATEEPRRSEPFSILIRRLPLDITEERLTLMVIWSKELMEAEVLLPEKSEDPGFRSAVLLFKSHAGASEAKSVLDGHTENDVRIIVEILHGTSISSRRRIINNTSTTGLSLTASSVSSTAPAPTLHSKFNLPSLQKVSPTNAGVYPTLDPPQSPSGNHLNRPSRVTSKSSSNTDIIDDNGTGKLMTPSAHKFFSFGARRLSSPQIVNSCITTSPSNTNAMSLSTSSVAAISDAPVSDAYIMSRTLTEGKGPVNCQPGSQYLERHKSSHVNPADQNPPCNTLYVGNLPIDTSEDELKAMFSKQRGYKRMCFRTKQSGPMCFVEFEDISLATKALHELYGHPLQNSIMGGIRLSFSKNSLGVRSGPDTMATDSLNALVPPSNTSAPPPRLSTSPGIAPEIICHSAAMSPVRWRK